MGGGFINQLAKNTFLSKKKYEPLLSRGWGGGVTRTLLSSLREDTHKKVFYLSGRTTKGLGRVNPSDH